MFHLLLIDRSPQVSLRRTPGVIPQGIERIAERYAIFRQVRHHNAECEQYADDDQHGFGDHASQPAIVSIPHVLAAA